MSCGPGAAFGKIIIKMITDISKMTVNLDVAVDVLIEKVKEEGAKAAMAAAEKAKQGGGKTVFSGRGPNAK